MPTARPIIIEKFMAQTDIGVTPAARWRTANPTAIPAIASTRGIPAATAEPNATKSRITVGRPDSSSASCSASSLLSLKSCHTAHSPVASADDPGGKATESTVAITFPAASGSSASRSASGCTGTRTARPLALTSPDPGGCSRGSTTIAAQLVTHGLGGGALGLPPGIRQGARQRRRQRSGSDDDERPDEQRAARPARRSAAQPRQEAVAGAVRRVAPRQRADGVDGNDRGRTRDSFRVEERRATGVAGRPGGGTERIGLSRRRSAGFRRAW